MKQEFKVIADLLPNNTRVLDVGCGDGSLMNFLVKEKKRIPAIDVLLKEGQEFRIKKFVF